MGAIVIYDYAGFSNPGGTIYTESNVVVPANAMLLTMHAGNGTRANAATLDGQLMDTWHEDRNGEIGGAEVRWCAYYGYPQGTYDIVFDIVNIAKATMGGYLILTGTRNTYYEEDTDEGGLASGTVMTPHNGIAVAMWSGPQNSNNNFENAIMNNDWAAFPQYQNFGYNRGTAENETMGETSNWGGTIAVYSFEPSLIPGLPIMF